ncbi:MAG: hypothetical protein HC777_00270 [Hyphomonadaceae bacterium]|nr:hypothetical protein [Hyphomonadaceae bacterium]
MAGGGALAIGPGPDIGSDNGDDIGAAVFEAADGGTISAGNSSLGKGAKPLSGRTEPPILTVTSPTGATIAAVAGAGAGLGEALGWLCWANATAAGNMPAPIINKTVKRDMITP